MAQLESKLDGLVTLLKAATHPTTPDGGHPARSPSLNQTQVAPDSAPSTTLRQDSITQQPEQNTTSNEESYGRSLYSPGPNTEAPPQTNLPYLPVHAAEPSPDEAEQMLHIFRTQYIQHLPFMVLPENLTARELRATRPALYLTIMSVTCTRLAQQLALGIEVRSLLARQIVVEGKKSLDLLLASLTYMTW